MGMGKMLNGWWWALSSARWKREEVGREGREVGSTIPSSFFSFSLPNGGPVEQ